ncbi:MAG TPA: hypothetical protein VFV05_03530 [Methylomirabilota bacterium]|nr:hypothetical protein [Methylomirabilota bacterium]
MTTASPPTLIDELMPEFDEFEHHEILVRAPAAAVHAALRRVDLFGSRVIRWLLLLRAAPGVLRRPGPPRRRGPLTLERLLEHGFVLLGERAERELVLGVVGRFWQLASEPLRLDAAGFRAFESPGYAKAVWDFRLAPIDAGTTRLSTDTRIRCLDPVSRRRFRRYWRVIRPFSGLIRIALLRAVAREATR